MGVGVNIAREGVNLSWVPGDYVGPVEIVAVNAVSGDIGTTLDSNDGFHFETYPPGFWEDHVTVYQLVDGERGAVVDEGDIAVFVAE
jgi:hypothetical protein